jgi:hypothetical protein
MRGHVALEVGTALPKRTLQLFAELLPLGLQDQLKSLATCRQPGVLALVAASGGLAALPP